MSRKRNILTGLAGVAAMLLPVVAMVGPAHAADPPPEVTFSFSPGSGLAGTKVHFTGAGCPHDATKTSDGVVFLALAQSNVNQAPLGFMSTATGTFTADYDTTGIAPGTYTTFASCTTTGKGGIGSPFTVNAPVILGSTYNSLSPTRILDTRNGTGTAGTNTVGEGGTIEVKVTGVSNVPATGVTAVALNVTAANASGPASYLTVFPTGTTRPLASNLNFDQGTSIPNLVVAQVGTDGKVSIYNNKGSVHVIGDVQGYYTNVGGVTGGSTFKPVDPLRLLDTRNGTGTGGVTAKVPAGGTIELKVTDVGGVPATGATAVVLNMTTTQATGPESFLTVWPAGESRPPVSNLNFAAGPPSTNAVVVRVGLDGKVAIYNNLGSTDVIADLNGWFAAPVAAGTAPVGQFYYPVNPFRNLDSRNGTGTGGQVGQLGGPGVIDVAVSGVGGVPANATAAVLNVTAADSPGPESYLTLFPTGTTRPLASNLNFVADQTVPNLVMVRLGGGKVTFYNNLGSVVVIADIEGYYAPQNT